LARGADSALAAKLGELAERLPPPAPGPEVPTLEASFVLETPGGDGTPLAPEERWSVEPAQDGDSGTALLAAGLALAPEGEGLDSTTPPPEETPRG